MATQARRLPLPTLAGRLPQYIAPAFAMLLVGLVVIWLGVNFIKTPSEFYRLFLIGLTNGAIYGLVALGYSLVYGILELINFAHGDVFMLGGMLVATMVSSFGLAGDSGLFLWSMILLMLVIVMAFCAVLNTTIELVAYRRLRHAPRLAPLITAIGMSFILQNVGLVWKGARPTSVDSILPRGEVFTIGGVTYTWDKLIVLLFTVPVLLMLMWLVQKTRQGKAMRATAQDRDASAMMGINVNRTISFTFFIAGALAGSAGLLYALYITNIRYDEGFRLGLIAFTAAVVGGIGNLPGAVLGGLLIAMIESFNNGLGWATPGSDWTQSIIFALLIIILVFRPEGLLGEQVPRGRLGGQVNIPGLPRERRADFDRELRPRLIKGGIASVAWIVLVIIFSGFTTSLIISTAILLALYAVPWDMLRYGKWVVPTVAILLAITYPYYRDDLYEVPLFGPFPSVDTAVTMTIFIMMAIGLNIVVGYAGLLDLGYVAFYAMGAYTAAWFASPHFGESVGNVHVGSVGVNPEAAGFHVSIWLVLIIAGIFTGIIGILIGLPTLRLRGDYLAIVTLGFGEIMPQIARNGDNLFGTGFNLTNGAQGINPIDPPGFGAAIAGWTGLPEDYLSFNSTFLGRRSAASRSSTGPRSGSCSSPSSAPCGFATRASAARGSRSARTRPPRPRWACL